MPRPKKPVDGYASTYLALRAQGYVAGETNDCSLISVAAVTGAPYEQVRQLFLAAGREPRSRTPRAITRRVLEQLGYVVTEVSIERMLERYPPRDQRFLRCLTSHHPDRFPAAWRDGQSYLLFGNAHVLAVVNGVNCDWTRGRAMRVRSLWHVYKKPEDTQNASPVAN